MTTSMRSMRQADLGLVLSWRNHPEVRRYMKTQHEITLHEHQHWFNSAAQNSQKHLLIFEIDQLPLGFVNFTGLGDSGIADWGFYSAPEAPKGIGRQLGAAAIAHAFAQLKLHKVCGQAFAYNQRSIQLHLSLGFQQEGILRDQHFDGERYHDVNCFGLLSSEWKRSP
jgi:UDP-4-amino-4,6-dideoxy-N-acetyl-beta-L-altrosamine N-acetyltransferase